MSVDAGKMTKGDKKADGPGYHYFTLLMARSRITTDHMVSGDDRGPQGDVHKLTAEHCFASPLAFKIMESEFIVRIARNAVEVVPWLRHMTNAFLLNDRHYLDAAMKKKSSIHEYGLLPYTESTSPGMHDIMRTVHHIIYP